MNNSVLGKIYDINNEDFIWYIYYAIITFNLISNKYEKESLLYRDSKRLNTSLNINKVVSTVAFFIYLYFLFNSYKNLKDLKKNAGSKKELLSNLSFLSSVFFLIGGSIILYVVYNNTVDDELGL